MEEREKRGNESAHRAARKHGAGKSPLADAPCEARPQCMAFVSSLAGFLLEQRRDARKSSQIMRRVGPCCKLVFAQAADDRRVPLLPRWLRLLRGLHYRANRTAQMEAASLVGTLVKRTAGEKVAVDRGGG